MKMQIDKRDLLTIIVLSIVFFSVATWNLGMTKTPLTTWQATEDRSFYIDLGGFESVHSVYLLVKFGSANVTVYTGSPENWSYPRKLEIPTHGSFAYYRWSKFNINRDARYIRFNFQQASIEVAEVAVLSLDNQKIAINAVMGEGTTDPNLSKLIDEQSLVQCPPTYMSEIHFDEKYFVRTAENYVNSQRPYEWTHPPLGKLILTSGILIFGYNPFGWRIMGVVFATMMIALIYLVGKELFGTWIGAFTSSFLLTFDFMNFAMGRMATVDVYVAFFSLASQLFFLIYVKGVLKNGWKAPALPLFLAILFFAFGISTKWIVLFCFLGQLAILLVLRLREVIKLKDILSAKINAFFARPFFLLFCFIALAVFVYFLTYIPDMLAGRSLVNVFNLQGSMFGYHSGLKATHPFASGWWTWPFTLRPVLLYRAHLPGNIVSIIVAMGNPAVWWVGFAFVFLAVERAIRRKDFACIFITVLFFSQWLPYALISRYTLLYHFYASVAFLCLATAYFLNKYWSSKWGKAATLAYFAVVVVLFGLFYPVTSGMPVSSSWMESIKWLESWVFH
ncbi:MAG: glycosyltransferase family 39 protein [Candidatus Bathyarchaeum sp.]|nr:MAG: glycosyltransferase family 39 protein [Candidatus Bathyarchaeum sp.]